MVFRGISRRVGRGSRSLRLTPQNGYARGEERAAGERRREGEGGGGKERIKDGRGMGMEGKCGEKRPRKRSRWKK